tara:strand:- start:184 stop:777 length:594 start_codon:yes stop_codon:yes gene_type:complete
VNAKGFSLVEILVVIAIIGIITMSGFIFLQDSLRDSRLQNELIHLEQLLNKYAKQSLTSKIPIQIKFSYNSPNTAASIYTMRTDDYSRFNKTDCTNINTDTEEHSVISETNHTFSNVFIKACDGSIDINICFSGRGDIIGEVIDEEFKDEAIDNESISTVYILPYQNLDCNSLDNNDAPDQYKLILYTSGYIDWESN